MTKYAVAAVLIGLFVTPAFALVAGPYFVGLNTTRQHFTSFKH
jgi:hypothetical protein